MKEEKPLSEMKEDITKSVFFKAGYKKARLEEANRVKKLEEWASSGTRIIDGESVCKEIDKIFGEFDNQSPLTKPELDSVSRIDGDSPQTKHSKRLGFEPESIDDDGFGRDNDKTEDNHNNGKMQSGETPDNHAQDVCECGHPKNYHNGHNLDCNALKCSCKKFKPAQEKK